MTEPHSPTTPGVTAPPAESKRKWLRFGLALGALVFLGVGFMIVSLQKKLGIDSSLRSQAGLQEALRPIPMEVAYVGPDVALMAFIDVRRVKESAFGRTLVSLPRFSDSRTSFLADTGIDLYSDVDSLLVVLPSATVTDRPLIIARGRFDPAALERLVTKGVAIVEQHRDVQIFTHGDTAITYVTPAVAIVGPTSAVRNAIDIEGGRQGIPIDADAMRLVAARRYDAAWLVARISSLTARRSARRPVAPSVQSLEWVVASGDISATLSGVVHAEARSDDSASDLRLTAAGLITLGKLRWRGDSEILRALDSLKLSLHGKTVLLAFQVPARFIEELLLLNRGPRSSQ